MLASRAAGAPARARGVPGRGRGRAAARRRAAGPACVARRADRRDGRVAGGAVVRRAGRSGRPGARRDRRGPATIARRTSGAPPVVASRSAIRRRSAAAADTRAPEAARAAVAVARCGRTGADAGAGAGQDGNARRRGTSAGRSGPAAAHRPGGTDGGSAGGTRPGRTSGGGRRGRRRRSGSAGARPCHCQFGRADTLSRHNCTRYPEEPNMPPATAGGSAAQAREHLLDLLGPLVTELGYDLEDVTVSSAGRRSLVRVDRRRRRRHRPRRRGHGQPHGLRRARRRRREPVQPAGARRRLRARGQLARCRPAADRAAPLAPRDRPAGDDAEGRDRRSPGGSPPSTTTVSRSTSTAPGATVAWAELGRGKVQVEFNRERGRS